MAIRYYDDAISYKLQKWIPSASNLRILRPDETRRLWELRADDKQDAPLQLPLIALSRSNDIELLLNIKNSRSYDGLKIAQSELQTLQWNVIPIKVNYQLDIYTKTKEDGEEYLRNFLFKLINNPTIIIEIPYNNTMLKHIANIRVLETVSDNSSIPERLFPGQFTRWTIQFELQDAFLFSVPYKDNWRIDGIEASVINKDAKNIAFPEKADIVEQDVFHIIETYDIK